MNENKSIHEIESTLIDTINLGSAIIVEISEESERLNNVNKNIKVIIKNAEEAKSIIKAMKSTQYRWWLWFTSFFSWNWLSINANDSTVDTTITPTNTANLLDELKQQALLINKELDKHLVILDDIEKNNQTAKTKLTN